MSPSAKVGLHRARVQCAESMARAQELAEARRFDEARALLEGRMAELSLRSSTSPHHRELHDDLQRCWNTVRHERDYRAGGAQVMSSCSQTHWAERSNVSSHPRGNVSYTTPSKEARKRHVQFFPGE